MEGYHVRILESAVRELKGVDRSAARRIAERIRWLAANMGEIRPEPLAGNLAGFYMVGTALGGSGSGGTARGENLDQGRPAAVRPVAAPWPQEVCRLSWSGALKQPVCGKNLLLGPTIPSRLSPSFCFVIRRLRIGPGIPKMIPLCRSRGCSLAMRLPSTGRDIRRKRLSTSCFRTTLTTTSRLTKNVSNRPQDLCGRLLSIP
jgi:hypothetical protein